MTAYLRSAAQLEVLERLGLRPEPTAWRDESEYNAIARNERVDSRISDGPDSELIPPGRGRSRTRGMRP